MAPRPGRQSIGTGRIHPARRLPVTPQRYRSVDGVGTSNSNAQCDRGGKLRDASGAAPIFPDERIVGTPGGSHQ